MLSKISSVFGCYIFTFEIIFEFMNISKILIFILLLINLSVSKAQNIYIEKDQGKSTVKKTNENLKIDNLLSEAITLQGIDIVKAKAKCDEAYRLLKKFNYSNGVLQYYLVKSYECLLLNELNKDSGQIQVFGIDHLGQATLLHPQGAQLAVAAQLLVEQRVLLLDQARFEQQCADLTGSADMADAQGLAQQARFIGIAQVGQQAAAQIDAFADIQRQITLRPMKDIHPRRRRHALDGLTQVTWVFIDPGLVKLGVATAVQLHAQFRNSVSAAVTTPHTSMVCPFLGRMSG